jgi:hemoglobin/transferrin/lactoferrin receptor protein
MPTSIRRCLLLPLGLLALVVLARAQTSLALTGFVKDATGAALPNVTVNLLNARQTMLATTVTDAAGKFTLQVAPGNYEVLVTGSGFAPQRRAVNVATAATTPLDITLSPRSITDEVTITADLGVVQEVGKTTQQVNVIGEQKLEERAKAVLAQVAQEEPGLQLQRTSPTISAIFVRGMTGAKVATYVDGIRFSTATARGGINTFFNLNEASNLRAVEVLRGPNSAQFGSDSIGGSVQLVSRMPLYSADKLATHGRLSTHYNSADHSFGGNTLFTFGGKDLAVLVNLVAHRSNTVRSGGGFDTHAAVNRFLGLRSDVLGERSTDTAFTKYGGLYKMSYRLTPNDQLSLHYNRAQLDGGKRFDQTQGGDGNLIADLRNFMLDFFYARYERFAAGPFDTFAVTYSYNAQREERVNQGGNGNQTGAITHQYERTAVNGVQAQASKQWGGRNNLAIGGEFYHDFVRAPAFALNPVNNAVSLVRPRVPDKATYNSGGVYVQDVWNVISERLRLVGALRYGRASYNSRAANSPLVNGAPLWPNDALAANAFTPRFGVVVTLVPSLTLSAQVSRGFRTPHITDLGTVGLTGNGFEANATDLAGKGALLGSTGDRNAISTGLSAEQLKPETSWSYEGGIHLHRQRVDFDVNGFINDVSDNIVLQSLILPPGATGLQLGDQRITSQLASGVVFVAASTNPVLIRANFGDSRIYGFEQKFEARLTSRLSFGENFTYLHAADKRTGAPPTIEGGTPAPQGNLRLRYEPVSQRFWVEPYLHAARRQDRLSTLDLDDRRTGATRSRANIASFFARGAFARGLITPGADGRFGTADDLLRVTNETVAQVQNRLLGNANSAPLYTYIPGFVTFGVRGGWRVSERHNVIVDLENLNDKNYRGISSGMDAPGRGISVRYSHSF